MLPAQHDDDDDDDCFYTVKWFKVLLSITNISIKHQSFVYSSSDCAVSYAGHTLGLGLNLRRDAVGVFGSPSRLG